MSDAIDTIIRDFGGLSEMARALGHKNPTTVQGWKERGCVPSRQIPVVIAAGQAREKPLHLTPGSFFDPPPAHASHPKAFAA